MKKLISWNTIFLTIIILFSLSGCKGEEAKGSIISGCRLNLTGFSISESTGEKDDASSEDELPVMIEGEKESDSDSDQSEKSDTSNLNHTADADVPGEVDDTKGSESESNDLSLAGSSGDSEASNPSSNDIPSGSDNPSDVVIDTIQPTEENELPIVPAL